MRKKIIQDCFKKYIVKRQNGMCQILFSLTELDNLCDEIKKDVFNEEVLDVLKIIKEQENISSDIEEKNGYAHSYAIIKELL